MEDERGYKSRKGPKRVPEECTLRGMLERNLRDRDMAVEIIERQLDELAATAADEEEKIHMMRLQNQEEGGEAQQEDRPHRRRVKVTRRKAGLSIPPAESRTEEKQSVKRGDEEQSRDEQASIPSSQARPPALEEPMESGAQAQPDLPNNHPEWGKARIIEPILDCASAQPGRWCKVETIKSLLGDEGMDKDVVGLGISWLFDKGLVSGDGFSQDKITKPKPGIRISGRHLQTSKTLFLTFFPEFDDDIELLQEWVIEKCEYSVAGVEQCPKTGRTHVHVVCEFQDPHSYRWLKYIFPTINIDADVRHKTRAIKYVQKVQLLWEDRKETAWSHAPEQKLDSKARAAEILRLANDGDIKSIQAQFPNEYLRNHATIHKLVSESVLKRFQERPNHGIDLKNKNLFLWGDPGTGKTWLARNMCQPRPYCKSQNKWWDGFDDTYTGIIFNDLTTSTGFNWQTVLDAADAYPFGVEIKNGSGVVDPSTIPVICTSNYSPEQLTEGWTMGRREAFERRFNFVRVQWKVFGGVRNLKWTFDSKYKWRPPEDERWWEQGSPVRSCPNMPHDEEESRYIPTWDQRQAEGMPLEEEDMDSIEE
jgi:hypothetical protein